MCAEAPFEELAALGNCFEALLGVVALTIISPQIAERLFTLKDCCRSHLLRHPSNRGDLGPIPAVRQPPFHTARGIPLGLRPKERQPLQPGVSLSFAAGAF